MTKEEYLSRISDNKIKEEKTVLKILKSFADNECRDVIESPLRTSTKGEVPFERNTRVSFVMRHYDDAGEILIRILKENYPFLNFSIPLLKVDKQMVKPPTSVFFDLSEEEKA